MWQGSIAVVFAVGMGILNPDASKPVGKGSVPQGAGTELRMSSEEKIDLMLKRLGGEKGFLFDGSQPFPIFPPVVPAPIPRPSRPLNPFDPAGPN